MKKGKGLNSHGLFRTWSTLEHHKGNQKRGSRNWTITLHSKGTLRLRLDTRYEQGPRLVRLRPTVRMYHGNVCPHRGSPSVEAESRRWVGLMAGSNSRYYALSWRWSLSVISNALSSAKEATIWQAKVEACWPLSEWCHNYRYPRTRGHEGRADSILNPDRVGCFRVRWTPVHLSCPGSSGQRSELLPERSFHRSLGCANSPLTVSGRRSPSTTGVSTRGVEHRDLHLAAANRWGRCHSCSDCHQGSCCWSMADGIVVPSIRRCADIYIIEVMGWRSIKVWRSLFDCAFGVVYYFLHFVPRPKFRFAQV